MVSDVLIFCRWDVNGRLTDQKWHQMCVMCSSKTTSWSIYLDGERNAFGSYDHFTSVPKEGTLGVATPSSWTKLLLTQLNFWDHVLTGQEIATFAQKCNQGFGNLVSWSDLYDEGKMQRYIIPSSCQPVSPSTTASPITPPSSTKKAVTT